MEGEGQEEEDRALAVLIPPSVLAQRENEKREKENPRVQEKQYEKQR